MAPRIESRDNRGIKYAIRVGRNRRIREKDSVFLVPGSKAVADTARAGYSPVRIYAGDSAKIKYRERLAGLDITPVSAPVLDKLSGVSASDGVYGLFRKKPVMSCDIFSTDRIIALVDVQDPVNVGAVLRTALALGYDRAAVSRGTADLFSPKVIRASMTASVKMPRIEVDGFAPFAGELSGRGYCTVAACPSGGVCLGKAEIKKPLALFIGNEGQGLPRRVEAACSLKVKIPMSGDMESLNAAVSRGIIMWETVRNE